MAAADNLGAEGDVAGHEDGVFSGFVM